MSDNVEFPDDRDVSQQTVTDGFFEREVQLSRRETATFLRNLADQIQNEPRVTIATSDWEIPFEFAEPIEVEVEFVGGRKDELEVEVEFTEAHSGSDLSVK